MDGPVDMIRFCHVIRIVARRNVTAMHPWAGYKDQQIWWLRSYGNIVRCAVLIFYAQKKSWTKLMMVFDHIVNHVHPVSPNKLTFFVFFNLSESWAWQSLLVRNRSRSDNLLWFTTYVPTVHFGFIFVIPCKSRNDRMPKKSQTAGIDQTSIQNRSSNAGRVFQREWINRLNRPPHHPPTIRLHQPSESSTCTRASIQTTWRHQSPNAFNGLQWHLRARRFHKYDSRDPKFTTQSLVFGEVGVSYCCDIWGCCAGVYAW